VFITRATRHDTDDLQQLYEGHGWHDVDIDRGVALIARDGTVIGAVRLIELEPQTVAVDDVLVRGNRRGKGIGTQLMKAAMNSRGGTLYLCCHADRLRFYGDLGFSQIPFEQLPETVQTYMRETDSYPDHPDHVHYFLKAR